MNKFKLLFLGLAVFAFGCGNSDKNDNTSENNSNTEVVDDVVYDDDALIDEEVENGTHEGVDLYSFIINDGKGWDGIDIVYYFSFMEDGRIFGQGDDGEASMWEGNWTLDGDILTVTSDGDLIATYQLEADGEYLLIDGYKYQKSQY